MATESSFDKWFILASADAMASRSYTTAEVLAAYESGALKDHTVIYHRFGSRREGMTVKDLATQSRAKKK